MCVCVCVCVSVAPFLQATYALLISPSFQFRLWAPSLLFLIYSFFRVDIWIFIMLHFIVSIFSSFIDFLPPPYLRIPPCSTFPGFLWFFTFSTVFAPGQASAFLQILRQLGNYLQISRQLSVFLPISFVRRSHFK